MKDMDDIDILLKAVEEAGRTPHFYGPQSDGSIRDLERAFSVTLPPSFVSFLRRFGGGGIRQDTPIAGIFENDALMMSVGGVFGETIIAREEFNLPNHYLVIYSDCDTKAIWCLDMEQVRPDGECPVIGFNVHEGKPDATIAPSFGDYFRQYLRIRAGKPGRK